jgi:hypothetical protein
MAKERAAGRRTNKALRAGLPKKKKLSGSVGNKSAHAAPAAGGGGSGDVAPSPKAPPPRWTAERRRAAKLLRPAKEPAAAAAAGADGGEADGEDADAAPARAAPPPRSRARAVSPSQHGSHFGNGASGKVNDEWQTTAEAWGEVAPLLQAFRTRSVWQPFYYDGGCAEHVRELGFEHVIHEEQDFFARCKGARAARVRRAAAQESSRHSLANTARCMRVCVCVCRQGVHGWR